MEIGGINMKWFNKQNTVEKVVAENEQRFVIEVGHNRNNRRTTNCFAEFQDFASGTMTLPSGEFH